MNTIVKRTVLSILGGAVIAFCPSPAAAQESSEGKVEVDGTLIVPGYVLPQSQLVSDIFRQEYAEYVNREMAFSPPPANDAPKTAWDKFDADYDEAVSGTVVPYWKQIYPVDVEVTKMAGVPVAVITPKGGVKPGNEGRVLINVHGGGFFAGRGFLSGQQESIPIASLAGIKVITVDYRMAPYFKYPAASEDSEAVYRELLKTYKPESIGIFGCSAGGALTAQSIAWYRSKGLPRPGAAGIFCSAPPLPVRRATDSSMWSSPSGVPWKGPIELAMARNMGGGYMSTADPKDPRAYPGISDEELAKFPPSLFFTGTRASEMSAAIVAHAKFLKLGVDSQIYIQEEGVHGSFMTFKRSPETHDAYTYIAKWFNATLAD